MLCWSIPQIMSHLKCDRVELWVCDWLENPLVQSKTSAMTQTSSGCAEKQLWMRIVEHVCVYCPPRLQLFASVCWNVLKVCSLALPSASPRKAYANWIVPPGVFGNDILHAGFAVREPAQSQDLWNPEIATYSQLQLQFFCFLQPPSKFTLFSW